MFCETCGKELPGRVDVCPFCGADVSDEFEDEIMEGQAAPQMNTAPQAAPMPTPAPQMNTVPQPAPMPAPMPTPVQPMQPQMATMNGQPMQQMQPNMPQMAPQPSLDQMKLKRISDIERRLIGLQTERDLIQIQHVEDDIKRLGREASLDTTKYEAFIERYEHAEEERQRTYDGMVYISAEESHQAEQTLRQVAATIDRTNSLDLATMNAQKDALTASNIQSKDKYITYLDNCISAANQKLRTVMGVLYDSEDEAREKRMHSMNIYNKLMGGGFASKEEAETLRADILATIPAVTRDTYLKRIDGILKVYQDAESLINELNIQFVNRLQETIIVTNAMALMNALQTYHLRYDAFMSMANQCVNRYLFVFGAQCASIDNAIDRYTTMVKHAISYQQHLNEKAMAQQGGFLDKMGAGTKGLFSGVYSYDYNAVMQYGGIPNMTQNDLNSILNLKGNDVMRYQNIRATIDNWNPLSPALTQPTMLQMSAMILPSNLNNGFNFWGEIKHVLEGRLLLIQSHGGFLQMDELTGHLRNINPFYFDNMDNNSLLQLVQSRQAVYMTTYRSNQEIAFNLNSLGRMGVTVTEL